MQIKTVIARLSLLLTLSACTIDANLYLIEKSADYSSVLKNEIQINLDNTAVSNVPAAEFSVSSLSQDVTGFYYKIGPNSSTDCLEKNGYQESSTSLDETQSVSLNSIPDGPMKICVIAKDKFGKTQPTSEYSYTTWIKDTQAPIETTISHSPYYYPSITTSPTFTWTAFSEENTISKYQIAIGTSPSTENILAWTDIGLVTSYQITSLNLSFNTVYYPRLRAIDAAGNISAAISNSGWYTLADLTAPASLTDMNFGSLSQTPVMKWQAPTEIGAGIKRYELSIGTSPGSTDILGWIPVGNTNNAQVSGLSLTNGQTYYPSLRAVDDLDEVSPAIQNDGFIAVNEWKNTLPTNPLHFISTINVVKFFDGGKRLIGGNFINGNQYSSGYLLKLNSDGSRDVSHYPNQLIKYYLPQTDEKLIVISGYGSNANELYRTNPDGTKDPSFESGPFFEEVGGAASFVLNQQPNGKIVIGGNFTLFKSATQNRIVKLNTDGTVDSGFNIGTGFNNTVSAVASFSDNKLLVSGSFTNYNGTTVSCLVKLNTDGSVDNTFTSPTFNVCPNRIVIQPDGKIILLGSFVTINTITHNRIVRLNADGSIDASFTAGTGFNGLTLHAVLQADGKIIVGGSFTTFNSTSSRYIARLNPDGTLDSGFNLGTGFSAQVNRVGILSNGKIVAAGRFVSYNGNNAPYIALLNSSGTLDQNFIAKYAYYVDNLFTTNNDKLLVTASGNYLADASNRIALQKSDGTLDRDFSYQIGTGFDLPADASVNTIAIEPVNNKIIIGGKFTRFNGTTQNYITRLNMLGALDVSFNTGTGFNGIVNTIALQNDNKIIAAGLFTSFNGTTINRIARLNNDGSLDTTFNIGTGFNGQVYSVAIQNDGKIIAGGDFTTFNGLSSRRIVRLNTDGSIDASFNIGTGFNLTVRSISIIDNDNVLVGGSFTTYNGVNTQYFTKLVSNGSKDVNFEVDALAINEKVTSIAIQSDKKILVGGSFTGTAGKYLARLNDDGSTDSTFLTYSLLGALNTATLLSIDISSDGKILTGLSSSNVSTADIYQHEYPSHLMLLGW